MRRVGQYPGIEKIHGGLRGRFVRGVHFVFLLAAALALSACATTGLGPSSGTTDTPSSVGPQLSSAFGQSGNLDASDFRNLPNIDVVVPVFDPGLPEDSDEWEKRGIYPELRRAESNRFALKMKSALEDTGAFGSVRVVPNAMATGDLYVLGKIIQSNGEDVKINIAATDISGQQWFSKDFSHRVKEKFHSDLRNQGKDPYQPVFEKAAEHIVQQLKKRDAAQLAKLQALSEIRFGASLSEETFANNRKTENGRVQLAAAPADADPMLKRIQEDFLQLYWENCTKESKPFPHARATLEHLAAAGVPMAVCTNKGQEFAEKILRELSLDHFFATIFGRKTDCPVKPQMEALDTILAATQSRADKMIMVGDSLTDIQFARATGMKMLAVSFGYSSEPIQTLGADRVIDHWQEALGALEHLAGKI